MTEISDARVLAALNAFYDGFVEGQNGDKPLSDHMRAAIAAVEAARKGAKP